MGCEVAHAEVLPVPPGNRSCSFCECGFYRGLFPASVSLQHQWPVCSSERARVLKSVRRLWMTVMQESELIQSGEDGYSDTLFQEAKHQQAYKRT